MRDVASLLMVGLGHERVTLDELARSTVRRDALPEALAGLVDAGFVEAVVVSTCSRTEIYAASPADASVAVRRGLQALSAWSGQSPRDVDATATALTGAAVVEHLFRVTAGLESRLVGDVDVLAQVRLAWRAARDAGTAGPLLSRLFPAAVRAAQRAHADTVLGSQGRSLAKRAVDVGLATPEGLHRPEVLVIGSGQMARVACEHLAGARHRFRVAARDEEYARRLAGGLGRACPLGALVDGVRRADLVICATSAAHRVLTLEHVTRAMAGRGRPLTIVDLAVPRNVEVEVRTVDGVRLVDLTELGDEAQREPAVAAAVLEASQIVDAAARRFCFDSAAASAGPLVHALRACVEQTCLEALRRHAGDVDPDTAARTAHAVTGKLMHRPTMLARAAAAAGDREALQVLCEAFGVPIPAAATTARDGNCATPAR